MIIEIAEGIGTVLVVEDEGLVSLMIEDIIKQMGVEEVRVCGDLHVALAEAGSREFDCAILDVRVRGGDTAAIADLLAHRGIPFMYSTGGTPDSVPDQHRHRPLINKPFTDDDFKTMLLDTLLAASNPCLPERVATPVLTD